MDKRKTDRCNASQPTPLKGQLKCLGRAPTWVDMVGLFPQGPDCLAAFLVSSAAEVLAGAKPANLIRILKRPLPCGRSVYQLWQDHHRQVLAQSQLRHLVLRDDRDGVLLLLYRRDLLEIRLQGRTMQAFLRRYGYPVGDSLEACLEHLRQAFSLHDSPDEVGIFLGYPVKDIKGFIRNAQNFWTGRCLWRVYGPPQRSVKLYQHYCRQRETIQQKLLQGQSPLHLLEAA